MGCKIYTLTLSPLGVFKLNKDIEEDPKEELTYTLYKSNNL